MNLVAFELFPCLLRAKQTKTKGVKETSKYVQTETDRTELK